MQDGETPLHVAAEQGKSEVVTKLLDSGAEVDMKNNVRKGSVMEWNIYILHWDIISVAKFLFIWQIFFFIVINFYYCYDHCDCSWCVLLFPVMRNCVK